MDEPRWTVPGYVAEALIGSGGSGEVWRGRVAATGEPVALKRLRIRDGQQLREARAEAAVLATLDHPNLIRLHDVVALPDEVVLVLDLASGGSLAELVTARGRLAPGEVIGALAPVAAALAYAHASGVVHADVTPSNVLFSDFGLPLLADLGIARLTGDASPARGTPAYLDPTVAAGGLPGPHSDVFMVAAVALHALTGAPPWPGETVEAVLAAARGGDLDVLGRLAAADVPAPVAAVLVTALASDPAARGTAADFALELRHSGEPVAVELAAGAPRAAAPSGAAARPVGARGGQHRADPARPTFDRPGPVASPAGGPALTRGVRVRPLAPRPVRRGRSRWVLAAVAAVVVAGVGAGAAWARPWHRASSSSAGQKVPGTPPAASVRASVPPASSAAPASPMPRVPSGARRSPAPSAADPGPGTGPETVATVSPADALAALAMLDAARERAFARRDAGLLAAVYLPGPLLDADAALLGRLVPYGCGLVGARTTYAAVQVERASPNEAVVTTTATLARSTLVCSGTATAQAPGAGPAVLRIRLARTGGGFRVAAQQQVPRG